MDGFIFADPRSQALVEQARRVAGKHIAVLVTGPTGSGKEVIARLVHEHSPRRHGPFVTVHCGAISAHLFESAFFGHVRGAFSGATRDRDGYLSQAHGGTLFLDELGELPVEHQVKLLRALDGYSFRPVGGNDDRTADVRFVGATNRDLEAMCREGRFREDLYGRISQLVLKVPPLAERPADVDALAARYAQRHRSGDEAFARAVVAAAARLTAYPMAWPRGVRELHAFVARADCFGVDDAESGMVAEWRRRGDQPARFVMRAPHTDHDREHLAGLIQATVQTTGGRPLRAATRAVALALADALLVGAPVPHSAIQDALDVRDRRTLVKNLTPLIDSGLVFDNGAEVTVSWPPVIMRLFHRPERAEDWIPVPPGAIPMARGSDRVRVEVTSQLPIELRLFLVTHRDGTSEPLRPVTGRIVITGGETRPVEFQLDEQPGFEQILAHLSWPTDRGMRQVRAEQTPLGTPTPHALQRQRAHLLDHAGPGWVEEFLVHHR